MPFNFGQFVPPEQPRQDPWPAIQSSIQHRNVMGQARSAAAAKQNMMDREYDLKEREYQRKSRKDIIDAMEKTVKFEAKFVGPLFSMVGKSGNPEQDAQDYKTTREMVAAKFTEIYGPAIANHKMQFIPEEYSPDIPKKIVEYYRKHVEDPSDYDKLITVGPRGKTRVRARRKTESLELEPGEQTLEQFKLSAGKDSWGEPYRDSAGNLVQKNLKTGKIYKVSAPAKGMEITTADGTTIRTGVPQGGATPTKAVTTDLQKKQVGNIESLNRIGQIVAGFKPEYQQIPTKLGIKWSSLKSKLNLGDVSGQERATLQDFASYKQDALENINLYIKDITGAQMSEKEANRLRKAMPDPGEGVFDGDDPITFKSKLINAYKKTRSAIARYNYYLSQGIDEKAINNLVNKGMAVSLEDMEKLIEQRAKEVMSENKNLTFEQVAEIVKKDFGLK